MKTNSCYKSEKELIDACLKQDRRAQRELYERFAPRMIPVCRRYVSDRDRVNDLIQDGFITVFSKIGTYSGDGSFEGWIRKVFVNTALMHIRKNDILKDAQDVDMLYSLAPSVDNVFEKLEGKEIFNLISQMPIGFKTIFNLNVIDGYSHQEISQMLNISEGSSRSQLSRARTWLQNRIINMDVTKK